jgi:hypothetical protein
MVISLDPSEAREGGSSVRARELARGIVIYGFGQPSDLNFPDYDNLVRANDVTFYFWNIFTLWANL